MSASHALDQARSRVVDALDTTQETVGDAARRARDSWDSTSKRLEKRAKRLDKDLKKLDKKARRVTRDAQKTWKGVSKDAQKTYAVASRNAQKGYREVDRYIGKNPRTATLVGAGIGLLIGALFSRR